jgi:hypothetical protein
MGGPDDPESGLTMRTDALLIELFVEELPPKALNKLGHAFAEGLMACLKAQGLTGEDAVVTAYASPRRLAAHISQVKSEAADKQVQQKLMPVSVGLNAEGQATPALLKKLQGLGLGPDAVAQLKRAPDGKAEALFYDSLVKGVHLTTGVQAALDDTIAKLVAAGAEVVTVDCPSFEYAIAAYYLILPAEASSNLAKFDSVRFGLRVTPDGNPTIERVMAATREAGFGPEVKRRIILGTYALSSGYYDAYYGSAQKVRTLIQQDLAKAFSQVDVLLTPTAPTTAFKIGEKIDDPVAMYLSDIFTVPANLAGVPALSVQWKNDSKGLPIGVQLMAEGDDNDSIESSSNIFQAIKTILIADLVMSLDNVVAVAAAAEKAPEEFRMPLILLGLAMSIPLIIFASTLLLKVMERYPIIITIGAALLGYLAGEMFVTDPAVTDSLHSLMDHPNVPFQILGILLVVGIGGLLKKKHAKSE